MPFTAPHAPTQGLGHEEGKASYAAMIERMGFQIGSILEVPKDTLAIFTSDNGATKVGSNGALRGFKSEVFEGGIRVPCLMK